MRRSCFGVGNFYWDNGKLQAPGRAFGFVTIMTLRRWGMAFFDWENMSDFALRNSGIEVSGIEVSDTELPPDTELPELPRTGPNG